MLVRVDVQHELDQRALKACPRSHEDREIRPGDLGRCLEVENTERLAYLPVRDRLVGQRMGLAPLPDEDVLVLVRPHRHGLVRHVGDHECERLDLLTHGGQLLVVLLDARRDLAHPRDGLGRVLARLLERCDSLTLDVSLTLELVRLDDDRACGLVQFEQAVEFRFLSLVGDRLPHDVGVRPYESQIQHVRIRQSVPDVGAL